MTQTFYGGQLPGVAGTHYGFSGLGVLGSSVPTLGDSAAGLLADDVQRNGWQNRFVRWRLINPGNFPNLVVYEDSSVYHPPLPDGFYAAYGTVSVDGIDQPGVAVLQVQVGQVYSTGATFLFMDATPDLTMDLPDCPIWTILDAVRRAATLFYTETRAWRAQHITLTATGAGQAIYAIGDMPPNAELTALPSITIAGFNATEIVPGLMDSPCPVQLGVSVAGPNLIKITPSPTQPGLAVSGVVAYRPSPSAVGIPGDLWREHQEPIRSLARSMLMEQMGKPWSSPEMAAKHYRDYTRLALNASSKAGPTSRTRLRTRPA